MLVLPLKDMDVRHRALTPWLAGSYLEAASVCLDYHHGSSPEKCIIEDSQTRFDVLVHWDAPSNRTRAAWANRDDATRDGAYAMGIAAVEVSRELYAIRRAETRTGADYYVALAKQDLADLEGWFRLEISGTNLEKPEVRRRLRQKLAQAERGNSNLPAIAAVVGFRVRLVIIQTVGSDL